MDLWQCNNHDVHWRCGWEGPKSDLAPVPISDMDNPIGYICPRCKYKGGDTTKTLTMNGVVPPIKERHAPGDY